MPYFSVRTPLRDCYAAGDFRNDNCPLNERQFVRLRGSSDAPARRRTPVGYCCRSAKRTRDGRSAVRQ